MIKKVVVIVKINKITTRIYLVSKAVMYLAKVILILKKEVFKKN